MAEENTFTVDTTVPKPELMEGEQSLYDQYLASGMSGFMSYSEWKVNLNN